MQEQDPKLAGAILQPATDALIETGEYELYGKYVNPKRRYTDMYHFYTTHRRLAEANVKYKEQAILSTERILRREASMLVACLVIAQRVEEAKKADALLRKLSESPALHESLDNALKGIVPPPLLSP